MRQESRFPLSVIVLTLNEATNITQCLSCLTWADELIVIDSGSTDDTIARARAAREDVRIFCNTFEDFGQQRNWALDNAQPRHDWILFLDADERMNEQCAAAIRRAVSDPGYHAGFFLCYRNMFLGRWIRHCKAFPSWQLRLLRLGRVRYRKEGHGQREILDGPAGYIDAPYDHLDLSQGMSHWIARHHKYALEEVGLLERLRREPLAIGDLFGEPIRRRRCLKRFAAHLGGSPFVWFFYLYIVKRGFLDGWQGYLYCQLLAAHSIHVGALLAHKQFAHRHVAKAAHAFAPDPSSHL